MSETVSVVIPHFRSIETLKIALTSIAFQTCPVHEVIIVDDCSGPSFDAELHELVTTFGDSYQIIRSLVNRGPGTARNIGLDNSTGTLVAFLDSDDVWHPNKVELQLNAFQAFPTLLAIANRRDQFNSLLEVTDLDLGGNFPARTLRPSLFLFKNPLPTSSVMLRNRSDLRFPQGQRYAEDFALWIEVSKNGPVAFIDAPLTGSFKDDFGEAGLSAQVWRMVRFEYKTFHQALLRGVLSPAEYVVATAFLTLRVPRRMARLALSRFNKKWK